MKYPEIKVIPANPTLAGMAETTPGIVYSHAGGEELKLTLISPWRTEGDTRRYPLVVFVQGSAWTSPNVHYEIPQLAQLAREGFVVATIVHRNCVEGHAFPAYLVDTKTAIRYLRAHAEEYGIDPERVSMYGTSSGGNTALLVGLTGDSPEFKSEEYPEQSDAVNCVVECFGPTDMLAMGDDGDEEPDEGFMQIFNGLVGSGDIEDVMRRMSPVYYAKAGEQYPPFLIVHGDADTMVPYEQGLLMYKKLKDCGANVRMIRVADAPHEGSFWSRELVDEIFEFIKEHN